MSNLRGVLLIAKPKGFTSHDVVARVRRIFKTKEVGHAGTLDPMAEGLLVVLLGEATKLSAYVTADDKSYVAGMDFGYSTDTLDTEGQVISEVADFDLSQEQITHAAQNLVGDLRLPVPIYSAVKLHGRKLYEYARSGQEVDIPVRQMKFYTSEVLEVNPKSLKVRLACEKGAYIRAWVGQMGEDLGVGATMTSLVRESSGSFKLSQSIGLEDLTNLAESFGVSLLQKLKKAEPVQKSAPTSSSRSSFQKDEGDDAGDSVTRDPLEESLDKFLQHVQAQSFFVPLEKCMQGRFLRLDSFEDRLMKNGQIAHSLEKRLVPLIHDCINQKKDHILRLFSMNKGREELRALVAITTASPRPKILRVFH